MGYEIKIDPTTNAETFEETMQLLIDGVPADLTGAVIEFNVQDPVGGTSVLRASSEDGSIFITPTDFTIRFEADQMAGITPKSYFVGITCDLFGDKKSFFTGTLQIDDGRMQ